MSHKCLLALSVHENEKQRHQQEMVSSKGSSNEGFKDEFVENKSPKG